MSDGTALRHATPESEPLPARGITRRPIAEARKVLLVVGGVALFGFLLDRILPASPSRATAFGGVVAVSAVAAGILLRRRLAGALGGLRFAGTLLFALAAGAAVATFVLQGKPAAAYEQRYGALARALLGLGLDDVAHSYWFAGVTGLTVAGLTLSMVLRWPPRARNVGFFAAHVGLVLCVAGAGVSALTAVRGRVNLRIGEAPATSAVIVRDGRPAGELPLGFSVRLDRFEVERYATEHRLAVYAQKGTEWSLKASFELQPGVRHRLPGGSSYVLEAYYPDFVVRERAVTDASGLPRAVREYASASDREVNPAVVVTLSSPGAAPRELLFTTNDSGAVPLPGGAMLAFERRTEEVKAYKSQITVAADGVERGGLVAVNEPFSVGGWKLYQVNYDPKDPRFSGLEAVRDPGVGTVFTGFALAAFGLVYMTTVEQRRSRRRGEA